MENLKIGFVGGGNMAEALVSGLTRAGHAPDKLYVSDVRRDRLQGLHCKYGIRTCDSNAELVRDVDILVLAVKPQQMDTVLKDIHGRIEKKTTVISIAAGISTSFLRARLGEGVHLVRVMPNTPALVGEGMSVLFCEAGKEHCKRAEYVLGAVGRTAWVENENMLHAVTAVSGSGPAYFFLLAELMQASAHALGLPHELGKTLVTQTALGASRMLAESGKSAEELRQQVTSPGGTTQAALEVMFDAGLADTVRRAIMAAAKRSKELAG